MRRSIMATCAFAIAIASVGASYLFSGTTSAALPTTTDCATAVGGGGSAKGAVAVCKVQFADGQKCVVAFESGAGTTSSKGGNVALVCL